jgi:arginyl-tRNA synthetase
VSRTISFGADKDYNAVAFMIFRDTKAVIANHIEWALEKAGLEKASFSVEHPTKTNHGDYATNVALAVARRSKQNTNAVAEIILSELERTVDFVDRIEIAGPGFINFHLKQSFFVDTLNHIRENSDAWGRTASEEGQEILFEYTSPNLFKPLHIGNLVGNIIGESLSRVYEYAGATVRRINYLSDIGLTVAKGVWGLKKTGGDPDEIDELGKAYVIGNAAYDFGGPEKDEIESINRALYAGADPKLNDIRARGIATSLARINELCAKLGTSFDMEIFESRAGDAGINLVRTNMTPGVFEESEGAVVYRGDKKGLHTRVFLNSQGLPTYEAKDLGNFKIKQETYPTWTRAVVVTGNEQTEYFKVIISALHDVFPEIGNKVIEHIPTGFLTLAAGKMSSRKGNVLTGESLIEELRAEALMRARETRTSDVQKLADMIAVGALKYQILRQRVGTNIIFDKKQSFSFEGDSGPYLQYTHARSVSVLEKAKNGGIVPSTDHPPHEPYQVERVLYQFPEVTQKALAEKSPHHIVLFLSELAGAYNAFYARERIADISDVYAPYKVALTDAVRATLANGLFVLGMEAPDKM